MQKKKKKLFQLHQRDLPSGARQNEGYSTLALAQPMLNGNK